MSESKGANILVVYYSMYKHIEQMATAVAKGVEAAGGKVTIMRVPETLPTEVLKKMGAPEKNADHKEATPADLEAADGIIFGIPTRFGMAAAQVKALIDRTGGLWMKGKLVGKPAGMFVSTGTQGGGQETTALTFVTQLVHHVRQSHAEKTISVSCSQPNDILLIGNGLCPDWICVPKVDGYE